MKQKQCVAIGAILLATVFWGMTFAFIKNAVDSQSSFSFLFWRFGIAAFILLIFRFKDLKSASFATYKAGFLLGLFLMGTVLFQTIGLHTVSASTASFITGISVILVPLFASVVDRRWPKPKVIFAALIALTGIGVISLEKNVSIGMGELLVLWNAVCFAIFILCAGKFSKGYNAVALTTMQCCTVFVLSGLLGLTTDSITLPQNGEVWTSILFCAIFASIFAFLLQLIYQKYISSTTTAIIFSCEPIFATLTAIALLGEEPSTRFYLGAGLIFLAILVSELNLKKSVIPQE